MSHRPNASSLPWPPPCRPRQRRISALLAVLAMALGAGCSDGGAGDDKAFVRDPPPADDGIYGFANGCYAVETFDGKATLTFVAPTADGAAFASEATSIDEAMAFHLRAADLGTYLLYDSEGRYLAAEPSTADASVLALTRPAKLQDEIDVLDETFVSPAEWRLQVSVRDPKRYQLQHAATNGYLTRTGLSPDPAQAAVITLHPRTGCATFPEMSLDATGEVKPRSWDDGDVFGVAELHSHMWSDSGFGGGGFFHGAPFHRLGVEHALGDCTRSHGEEGRRDLMGSFFDGDGNFTMASLLPVIATGKFPKFSHHTDGYPTFTDWPNSWARSTHQTIYYRWLQRAYLAGLRLTVQLATGNSVICDLTVATGAQKTLYACNDMVAVDHAIARAHALERYVDAQAGGPGEGWLRVVTTATEARAAIEQGKLAMVIGIEISNLFDCFLTPPPGVPACTVESVRAKLDQYRKAGISAVFPVHKYDNAFSAGDGSDGVIEVGNFVNSGHDSSFVPECPPLKAAFDGGDISFGGLNKPREVYDSPAPHDMSNFAKDPINTLLPHAAALQEPATKGDFCQKHGLTPLGEALLLELMKRGMLIDVAHLPRKGLARAYELLAANDYPALKTHGDSNDGKIYELGGLGGMRFETCGHANKSKVMAAPLAEAVAIATAKGAYPAEGLKFDLNGFAGGPRPRFGPNKTCGGAQANPVTYPFTSMDGNITFTQPMLGQRKVDFNTEGMIHLGLLPELLQDVRQDGATDKDLEPLFRSAEAFLRMWQKAEARAKVLAK